MISGLRLEPLAFEVLLAGGLFAEGLGVGWAHCVRGDDGRY
jgi:hypothetical protein